MRKVLFLFLFIFSFLFLALKPVSAGVWTTNSIYDPVENVSSSNVVAVGSDNLARIAVVNGTNSNIDFLRCTNTSCTTYVRHTIEEQNGTLDMVLNASDQPQILVARTGMVKLISCSDQDCTAYSTQTIDSTPGSISFNYPSISIAESGNLRILYYKGYDYDTFTFIGAGYFVRCNNISCSDKTTTNILTDNSDFLKMKLGNDGFGRIIFADYNDYTLKYLVCEDDACLSHSSVTVDTGDVGDEIAPEESALAIGLDGKASFTYTLNSSLKFVHCNNDSCSDRVVRLLENNQGNQVSIGVRSDNEIRIAFESFPSQTFKLVTCSEATCATHSTSTLDGTPNVAGGYNSMAIGNYNVGYVAFSDTNNQALSLAFETSDPTPTPTAIPTPTPTAVPTATPTPTAGPTGPRPDGERSTTETPTCNDSDLKETPDLFQITTSKTTATLYFSPISDIHKYYVSYGTTESAEQYGAEFEYGDPSGVLSYSVNMLSPNQTYYFKVRGGRGCRAGAWGNVMKAKTTSGSAKQVFYKNIFSQIFTSLTNNTAQAKTNTVLGASTKPKSCSYVVESGDSLWSIAQSVYSNGDLYTKLMKLNKLKDTTIHPGQKLKAC